jgi:hypothetical protein
LRSQWRLLSDIRGQHNHDQCCQAPHPPPGHRLAPTLNPTLFNYALGV